MNLSEQSQCPSFNARLFGLVLFCLALAVASATPAYAEPLSASAAINKAGRQRMLSQRIVKVYCQIGMHILSGKSKAILESSSSLFDTQLAELKQYSDQPEFQEAIAQEEQLWSRVKLITTAPASLDGARKLLELDEKLLQAADHLAKFIEKTSNTQSGHLVNIAGRQRMLSQRVTKFYMLKNWGFDQPEILNGIEQSQKEFGVAMQELESSPQNTPQINQSLSRARKQWENFVLPLGENKNADTSSIMAAALASEHILEVMDKITSLYEIETAGQ